MQKHRQRVKPNDMLNWAETALTGHLYFFISKSPAGIDQINGTIEQCRDARYFDDGVQLPRPGVAEEVLSDYRATGLTLRAHPMSLLRGRHPFNRCKRHTELAALGNKRFVRIAGLVTCRQRPGSASGVLFLTLEDETGSSNIVIWTDTFETHRRQVLASRLMRVTGKLQREGDDLLDRQCPVAGEYLVERFALE